MQHQSVDEARRTTSSAQSKYHALQNTPPPSKKFFWSISEKLYRFFQICFSTSQSLVSSYVCFRFVNLNFFFFSCVIPCVASVSHCEFMPLLLYLEVCFHLWISAIFISLLCYLPAPFDVWLSLPAPYYPSFSSVYLVGLSSFFVGLSSHVPLVFCILFCGISFCFWAACFF